MIKKIAYIRTSTDKQDLNNQKLEIFEFAIEIPASINKVHSFLKKPYYNMVKYMHSVLH